MQGDWRPCILYVPTVPRRRLSSRIGWVVKVAFVATVCSSELSCLLCQLWLIVGCQKGCASADNTPRWCNQTAKVLADYSLIETKVRFSPRLSFADTRFILIADEVRCWLITWMIQYLYKADIAAQIIMRGLGNKEKVDNIYAVRSAVQGCQQQDTQFIVKLATSHNRVDIFICSRVGCVFHLQCTTS
jgi:hypothetical protein